MGGLERLQNITYADDLMIYATSLQELVFMLEVLFEELRRDGLDVNPSKSLIFTTQTDNVSESAFVSGGVIPILKNRHTHRYLGRI